MPTLDDFLIEICARPDDDEPRLVCADWLEERGDPRAKFIRTQIACAALLPETLSIDEKQEQAPAYFALWRSARAILAAHGKSWDAELKSRVGQALYRRGFVESCRASAEAWIAYGARLTTAAPLTQVEFTDVTDRAHELAQCPALSRLRRIVMESRFRGRHAYEVQFDTVRDLCSSPYLESLAEWAWDDSPIGDDGVACLTERPWPGLRVLELNGAALTDAALRELGRARWLAQLTWLGLSRNTFSKGAHRILERSPYWNERTRVGW